MTSLDALTLIALRDAANDGREDLADYDSGEVEYMRDGLAAAAPVIAAQALRDAADEWKTHLAPLTLDQTPCPSDWLRWRADRLEAGQ